ncbi:unnamed protein product [Hymenolepis diminuta]|uniref:RNA-binding protein 5 n=1 Tax=Hymenolepis diminuta TaxID=6216 RepID=A0A0R3SVM4_HYMDI|nr:unnamed protein product [Hymenolepis diminuta]
MRDRSRCFAFVDFHPEEARNFIHKTQNEIRIRGFRVSFDYADPKDEAIISERSRSNDPRFSGNVEEPTSNIMVRGIPADIDERDIMEELNRNNVNFADVRVIRDRQTGVSRGFGFIEFASTQEAIHWMDAQNGVLHVLRHVMRLNFSSPRNQNDSSRRDARGTNNPSTLASGDWQCLRCSSHNFKRRDVCFRCQNPRPVAQQTTGIYNSDGSELIGTTPCNTLILRCLDAYTTEASIQAAFSDQHSVQIKRCFIVRDGSNNASRFAVAELSTVADAYNVIDTIMKEHKIFEIEGKAIAVGYAKNNFNPKNQNVFSTIMATLKAEGAIIEPAAPNNTIVKSAVPTSATAYPGAYPTSQIPVPSGVYPNSGVAVAQAAIELKQAQARLTSIVAQSVHNPQGILGLPPQQASQVQPYGNSMATFPPPSMPFNATTAATTEYPFPDATKFLFDETIRYYYDPVTGLLYEPNTRYFFDRLTQQYFHYDATKNLYIPASQVANQQQQPEQAAEAAKGTEEPSKKKDKKEKEKNAQKIAKEMEKWAKRMNSQKEAPISVPKIEQQQTVSSRRSSFVLFVRDLPQGMFFLQQIESSKTADMGYAVLQASTNASTSNNSPKAAGLVAQYGGDDSEDEDGPQTDEKELETQVSAEETKLIDWTKLACLLCARGFKDADTLQKHRVFSNLHLQSVNKLRAKYGLKELTTLPVHQQPQTQKQEPKSHAETIESLRQLGAAVASNHAREVAANRQQSISASPPTSAPYRDRAKERREKFGTVPPPQRNFDRSANLSTMPTLHSGGSMNYPPPDFSQPPPQFNTGAAGGADVGSRLMAKMGWQAGQGLGKANQGRTQLVEAEFREAGVGLGVKASKRLPPSDNYKDNVKRAMYARYHDLG